MTFNESDIFVPLYISNMLLNEDHCLSHWNQNIRTLKISAMTLESLENSAILRFKNGNTYIGQVTRGKLHGKGRIEFADGIIYEGGFTNNRIEGEGLITWTDGSNYRGSFKNGVRNGYGEYSNPIKDVVYNGEWLRGMRHGKGELKLGDGSYYIGEFKNGLKQGEGKLVYPSGNTYVGTWKFNKKNGRGVMNWYDINQRYDGDWVDDTPNGVGNLIWLDEKGMNKILRNRYNGEFKQGLRHGLGIFYYANGSTYEGEWFENRKQGYAVFVNENGQAMYGFYKNDRLMRRIYVFNSLLETLIKKNMKEGEIEFKDSSRDDNMINSERMEEEEDLSIQEQELPKEEPKRRNRLIPTQSQIPKSKSKNDKTVSRMNSKKKTFSNISAVRTIPIEQESQKEEDPLITLRNNVYMKIVKVTDFIHDEGRDMIKFRLCEVLLRHHSIVKDWYRIYSEKNSKEYDEGFFVTISGFWQLLIDTRLINGRLNYVSFCRILGSYAMRDFELFYDEKRVKSQIELMKKYDFEKLLDDDLSSQSRAGQDSIFQSPRDDMDTQDEINEKIKTVLIDKYNQKEKKSKRMVGQDKVLLQRFFINALIRAVYLKTGSIQKLPEQINKIFKNRIQPIISGKVRPKMIVNEHANIVRETEAILDRFDGYLKEIFNVRRRICSNLKKGELMDLKSFIDIIATSGILNYDTLDQKKNFWMILESKHDPYDSIFNFIKKIQKSGRYHPMLKQFLRALLLQKLQSEITFDEFKHNLLIIICKLSDLNSRKPSFKRKISHYFNQIIPRLHQSALFLIKKRRKKPRVFPVTQKDLKSANIAKIREERLRALRIKRQKLARQQLEAKERIAMRVEDYDVTDLLAGLIMNDIDEEDTDSQIYLNDDSFFEEVDMSGVN